MTPFARLIRAARTRRGISQLRLADQIGLEPRRGIGHVERGEQHIIARRYWPKLAEVLQVSEADLEQAARLSSVVAIDPVLSYPPWQYVATAVRVLEIGGFAGAIVDDLRCRAEDMRASDGQ